ncbi:MAG: glycosyltransferase family A protein [Bacteroidota bacterium]
MLVSIIIPAYNCADFVEEAIACALGQTGVDIEVILVDNNSTDTTLEVLHKAARQHPTTIQVLQATTQGPAAARNRGLAVAQGEWIQFLDADDLIAADKISGQLALVTTEAWVVAAFEELDLRGTITPYPLHNDPWKGLALGEGIGQTSANLFRRSALQAVNGFDETLLNVEDHNLFFRLLAAGYLPYHDHMIGATVRDRPTNKQSRFDQAGQLERRVALHQRMHLHLRDHYPKYYQAEGDFLRATLLNHYRYWAHFARDKAVPSAKAFFPLVGGLPRRSYGLLPEWILLGYRFLGLGGMEWLRSRWW